MITWGDFESTIVSLLSRDIRTQNDPSQHNAIQAPQNQSLFIAAGPGSGKTTVIALRVLKLVYVDDIDPSNILVTTFTRRAAAELRSRILGWGDQLRRAFLQNPAYSGIGSQLGIINFNNIITGTLDRIAEEILGDPGVRPPGTPAPAVIEAFVSNALMRRVGLFPHGRHDNRNLKDYVAQIRGSSFRLGVAEKSATLIEIKERFLHDQIDVNQYRNTSSHPGIPIMCDAINDYSSELANRLLFDFARLEQEFLRQLQGRALDRFLEKIKFVLVDEYQDTNLLQEQIYFELAMAASRNLGSITVVGDDDQSLYRFRGATIDLFQIFPNKIRNQLGISSSAIYLSRNYRSTSEIVNFGHGFITLDSGFGTARVQNKPQITSARRLPYINYPILGMFRDDVKTLAHDLASLIHNIVHGSGSQIRDDQGSQYAININPQGGSPADVTLLCSSPRELDYSGNPRLPLLLKFELRRMSPAIQVFNPRGQNLESIPDVQRLCGLILECIDPNRAVQNNIPNLPLVAVSLFDAWRTYATNLSRNPPPNTPNTLGQFISSWKNRIPLGRTTWQPRETPLIDLVYKLVTWIPNMQNDIEGLVYLEAITRTINQTSLFSNFGGEIIIDTSNPNLEQASISEALWNIFVPIATGAIEINEDLLKTLPNDRINVLSIHQAKGLEFPLVIVDVGSDFRDLRSAAFKRFPRLNNNGLVDRTASVNMEDEFRPYSPLGRSQRSPLDRAFDDLIRHYYVSYSRAQDVLLLVGLNSVKDGYYVKSGYREIPNIATGWTRAATWNWGRGLQNLRHI